MVSISGVRGVIGDGLTPFEIVRFTSAFAEFCGGGQIMIGRDTRVHSQFIAQIVSGTLLAMGYDVVDVGVCPMSSMLGFAPPQPFNLRLNIQIPKVG